MIQVLREAVAKMQSELAEAEGRRKRVLLKLIGMGLRG
jgi:hypothetical protein